MRKSMGFAGFWIMSMHSLQSTFLPKTLQDAMEGDIRPRLSAEGIAEVPIHSIGMHETRSNGMESQKEDETEEEDDWDEMLTDPGHTIFVCLSVYTQTKKPPTVQGHITL